MTDAGMSLGQVPTEHDAVRIASEFTGSTVVSIRRFSTGLAHYVYDVLVDDGRAVVVRLTRPEWKDAFAGAVYWSDRLRPLGVPLPEMIFADTTGEAHGFPVLILERLPGVDLGDAYPALTAEQKRHIAEQVVGVQRLAATLPPGNGFGYAHSYDDPALKPNWKDVLDAHLERSRRQIRAVEIVDEVVVERVQHEVDARRAYFERVEPVCFLDDTTTKNVIVADGRLSGIVDVDVVCFGDALRTPALTQMALLNLGYDDSYIDAWLHTLSATREQRAIMTLYTATFCVDFLAELGQRFNQDEARPVEPERLRRLMAILDYLLQTLGS
ncbi:MAG TPA: aminoglycoside phosphotransferase family protein [Nitrolancea sp.]|jgi:hypothetical protein|nr:aminoglycoside phosphotransferase family protein [Nitrolancea sp.]